MSSETLASAAAAPGASPSAVELDPELWQRLFSLSKKEADDRMVLSHQLRSWCRARGVADAALYSESDGVYGVWAKIGESRFPREIQAAELAGLASGSWASIELPQAVLLTPATSKPAAVADSGLMLLAAGARISTLKRQIQQQSFQAMFRGVELQAIYDVGLAIASTLDLDVLHEEVLLQSVSLLDARRGAFYLLEDGHYRLTSRFGGVALSELAAEQIDFSDGECRGPEGWIPDARHLLAVPVELEGKPCGLLVVADKESRRGVGPFQPTDRRTLSLFANQAAIALENAKLHKLALDKERLEREMELAAEIQNQILPKTMPDIPGFEVIGWNRPARQVGGDYYDFQEYEQGSWGLVVGDVTGKGMPAALLVSTLHSALRVLLDRMEVGPPLIERLNRHIYESSAANKFITLLFAALDTGTSRLTYLNAGHNPGLLVRENGSVEELTSGGLPLGLMPGGKYGSATLELAGGDLVCLYSDGITESESRDEEEFGLVRLGNLLRKHHGDPLPALIRHIDREVSDFSQGLPQGDDQTVVLLRRRPAA